MPKDYPWGKGTPIWVHDATANDSDKSFTVPAGKVWDMKSILAQLTTTATVGDRFFAISITDGTNPIIQPFRSAAVAASKTAVAKLVFGTMLTLSTSAQGQLLSNIAFAPDLSQSRGDGPAILSAGCVIRVYDTAAIDAAADDLIVVLHYVEYDA